jgi:hypothetical protein
MGLRGVGDVCTSYKGEDDGFRVIGVICGGVIRGGVIRGGVIRVGVIRGGVISGGR